MKKFALGLAALAFVATGCNDDDDDDDQPVGTNVVVSGELSGDVVWDAINTYELDGRVVVPSGASLTIPAGTVVKGQEGQDTEASALIVARGGQIFANGTSDNPIIFTSVLDNIADDSDLGKTDNQLWGGVIILGAAKISAEDGDTETTIEGLPANEEYAKYGGSNDADNSGVFTYVSIRHGGISIGAGNEINGLTLGGVGNGTTIENVEVYATLDDGIECFGGSVNLKNALVFYQGDDGVDLDMNYSGTFDNFAVIHGDGIGTDEGLEIDGPEGSTYTDGLFTLKNGTIMTEGADGSAGDFKSKAQGNVMNLKFSYNDAATLKIRASYQNECADAKTDAFTHLTQDGTLTFTGNEYNSVSVYTGSTDSQDQDCSVPAADQTQAESSIPASITATGADMSVFSWTNAASRGEL